MSQKKVDRYKNIKTNRSKAARKEKLFDRLEILAWVVIAVAMVGWIGYSAYVKISSKQASIVLETAMDTTALDNYLSDLSAETEEDTEEADSSESAEESDEAETEEASDTVESTEASSDTAEAEETAEEDTEETKDADSEAADTDTSSEE